MKHAVLRTGNHPFAALALGQGGDPGPGGDRAGPGSGLGISRVRPCPRSGHVGLFDSQVTMTRRRDFGGGAVIVSSSTTR